MWYLSFEVHFRLCIFLCIYASLYLLNLTGKYWIKYHLGALLFLEGELSLCSNRVIGPHIFETA